MLSKTNIKYIQSLHHKKLREEEQCFIAEGPKVVSEFLLCGAFFCKAIYGVEKWFMMNQSLISNTPPETQVVIDEVDLEKISILKTPNQVLAIFANRPSSGIDLQSKITLVLDDIQDPGNMGTIIRIADWFNIQNIICSDDCVECYNPKVVQASMGSLCRVNILYTDLSEYLHQHPGIKTYAATLSGKDISSLGKIKEGIIIIGNESKGINSELCNLAQEKVTISKFGGADSLNAAVATGIILSHIT